jgi:hypothetical protein
MIKNLIIVGYARAGLTIVNRYLTGDDRLICLSEINTKYICPTQPNTPHNQMKNWYNVNVTEQTILEEIVDVLNYCEKKDKALVVRDWSFGSFVPSRYNNFNPSNTLNTVDDILGKFPERFEIICIVRNPIDIWLSMRYSEKTFYDKELKYLLQFTKDVLMRKIDILRYEDFCESPLSTIKKIYNKIKMVVPEKLELSNNVVGDTNYPSSSRGADQNQAIILDRRKITDEDYAFLKKETVIDEISDLLNYEKL